MTSHLRQLAVASAKMKLKEDNVNIISMDTGLSSCRSHVNVVLPIPLSVPETFDSLHVIRVLDCITGLHSNEAQQAFLDGRDLLAIHLHLM